MLTVASLEDLIQAAKEMTWAEHSPQYRKLWYGHGTKGPTVVRKFKPLNWAVMLNWDQRHPGEPLPSGIVETWEIRTHKYGVDRRKVGEEYTYNEQVAE